MGTFAEYITSFINGRVRVRHPALCDASQAAQVRALLGMLPGVLSVSVNSRTGSLLLTYDPEQLSKEALITLGEQWMGQTGGMRTEATSGRTSLPALGALLYGPGRRRLSRGLNRGMLLSLGASLAFGLTGRMGAHAVAGGLFMLLNAAHLYMYRRCL